MARHVWLICQMKPIKLGCTAFFPRHPGFVQKGFGGGYHVESYACCRSWLQQTVLALSFVLETSLQARGETQFPRLFGQRDWPLVGVCF